MMGNTISNSPLAEGWSSTSPEGVGPECSFVSRGTVHVSLCTVMRDIKEHEGPAPEG